MLICTAVFCLQFFLPLDGYFALWALGSGRFWPWQVFTYAFLHGSLLHLFFNMLGLWMFGADLAGVWGPRRFGQLLAASVITAALAQLAFTQLVGVHSRTVGASGGLYGLLLAYALEFRHRRYDLVGMLPMLLMMLPIPGADTLGMVLFVVLLTNRALVPIRPIYVSSLVIVAVFGGLELLSGLFYQGGSGIAHFAHLGGMLGAWLTMRWWRGQRRRR